MSTNQKIREDLIAFANAAMAAYPQYKGHFDNHILVRVKRTVKTKLGVAFTKGEIAIANPKAEMPDRHLVVSVWSVRNKVDTFVGVGDVEGIDVEVMS